MKTITRKELAEAVEREVGLSRTESRQLVDDVLATIVEALEDGEDVKLSRFGVFDLKDKAERPGRNPRTGETATITPRRVVTFRPSNTMKARVNGEVVADDDED